MSLWDNKIMLEGVWLMVQKLLHYAIFESDQSASNAKRGSIYYLISKIDPLQSFPLLPSVGRLKQPYLCESVCGATGVLELKARNCHDM